MKKLLIYLLVIMQICCSCCVVSAAGGGIIIGDSNPELLFTGSSSEHTLLLSGAGVVSAWGKNNYGQCGTEKSDYEDEPNYIDFEAKIVKVAAGNDFSIALDENGTAWGWGNNQSYQLGISESTDISGTPTDFQHPVKIIGDITDIAAGNGFSVLLNKDGNLYLSGNHKFLQKMDLNESNHDKAKQLSVRGDHIMVLGESGQIYSWNFNAGAPEVVDFKTNEEILSVSAGTEHGVVVTASGDEASVYTFGNNSKYQLGMDDNTLIVDKPQRVLSFPYGENTKIKVTTGDYATFVDVYENISERDYVNEYCFGSGCYYTSEAVDDYTGYEDGYEKDVIKTPEKRMVSHITLASGKDRNIAYRVDDAIEFFGNNEAPNIIHLLESDHTEIMYPYQYDNTKYQEVKVNFVKINKEAFEEGNSDYLYWEYADDHQFRVKIKDFYSGNGPDGFTPAISVIRLDKQFTGESRTIGAYGPEIWNFDRYNESYKAADIEIQHGEEDGKTVEITASQLMNRAEKALEIPSTTEVFFEEPKQITENTKLGLYIYGLPKGTNAEATIEGSKITLKLIGNSTCDMDYDSTIGICYVYSVNDRGATGCVGDFDLDKISAAKRTVNKLIIKAYENTPEVLTAEASLTKGNENGKEVKLSISGGEFLEKLTESNWSIDGSSELSVSEIKRVDDHNAIAVISGNSADKYTASAIKITCSGDEYYDSRVYDEESGHYSKTSLTSNEIAIAKQTNSGHGGGTTSILTKPTASVAGGTVEAGTKVQLSGVSGAKIYYTTDGTTPTDQSNLYTAPIEIKESTTLKFIAISGNRKSAVQTIEYIVKNAEVTLKKDAQNIKYIENPQKQFQPDAAIARYEVLKYINNLFDIEDMGKKSEFTDVEDQYEALVDLFVGAKLIEGYPDNTFRGNAGITRAEFVKILNDVLKPSIQSETKKFTDTEGHWCEKYIGEFGTLGYLSGYPDNSFKPDAIITKAEAVAVLNRIAGIKLAGEPNDYYTDVPVEHWAHDLIYAASETADMTR